MLSIEIYESSREKMRAIMTRLDFEMAIRPRQQTEQSRRPLLRTFFSSGAPSQKEAPIMPQ